MKCHIRYNEHKYINNLKLFEVYKRTKHLSQKGLNALPIYLNCALRDIKFKCVI